MPATGLLTFKVVLVGDGKVGKTLILNRWNNPSAAFDDFYEPTVSPELTTKEVAVDGRVVRLQVWDMGFGEQDAAAQFPRYVGGAAGAVLMYDMSDAPSAEGVEHWHEQVRSLAGPSCAFVVSGCKADLPPAAGALQKARGFCQSIGVEHVETSAQSGTGASRLFEALARELFRQSEGGTAAPAFQDRWPGPEAQPTSLEATVQVQAPAPQPPLLEAGRAGGAGGCPGGGGPAPGPARSVKLVLLGEPCVGKSCLAQRLGGDPSLVSEDYVATAGPEIITLRLPVNGAPTKLQVWDAPGEALMSDSKMIGPVMQGVGAALIVYDVTARGTFESVRSWMRLLEGHAGAETAVMLVGNKADAPRRAVSIEDGRRCAEALQIPFAEFSALREEDASGLICALLAGGRPPPAWESTEAAQAAAAATAAAAAVAPTLASAPAPAPAAGASGLADRARAAAAVLEASYPALAGSMVQQPGLSSPAAVRTEPPVQTQVEASSPALEEKKPQLLHASSPSRGELHSQAGGWKADPMGLHSTELAFRGTKDLSASLPAGPASGGGKDDGLAGTVGGAPGRQRADAVRRRDVGSSPPRPKEPRASEPLPKRALGRHSHGALASPSEEPRPHEPHVTSSTRPQSPAASRVADGVTWTAPNWPPSTGPGSRSTRTSPGPSERIPERMSPSEAGSTVVHLNASLTGPRSNHTTYGLRAAEAVEDAPSMQRDNRHSSNCLLPMQGAEAAADHARATVAAEVAALQAAVQQQASQQPPLQRTTSKDEDGEPMKKMNLQGKVSKSVVVPAHLGENGEPARRVERPPSRSRGSPGTALVPGAAGPPAGPLCPLTGSCAVPAGLSAAGGGGASHVGSPGLQGLAPTAPGSPGSGLFAPGGGSQALPPGGGPPGSATSPALAAASPGQTGGSVMLSASPPGSSLTFQNGVSGPYLRTRSPEASMAHSQPVGRAQGGFQPRAGMANMMSNGNSPEVLSREVAPGGRAQQPRSPQAMHALDAGASSELKGVLRNQRARVGDVEDGGGANGQQNARLQRWSTCPKTRGAPSLARYEGSAVVPTWAGGTQVPWNVVSNVQGRQHTSPMGSRPGAAANAAMPQAVQHYTRV